MPFHTIRSRLASLAVATLCLGAAAHAQPIRVLTLDQSRTNSCGLDLSLTGPFFTQAVFAMTSPTSFGPAGTVQRSLTLAESARLDGAALAAADLVVLPKVNDPPLDAGELMALNSFLLAGGGLVLFENDPGNTLRDVLGVTAGAFYGNEPATVADAASPTVNGPFGVLAVGTAIPHQFCGSFADVGALGRTAIDIEGEAFAADFALGAGRVAAFGDEETFMSMQVSGCASGIYGSIGATLLLNSVAWAAAAPGFGFDPVAAAFSELGPGCDNGVGTTPSLALLGENTAGGRLRFRIADTMPDAPGALLFGPTTAPLPVLGCRLYITPLVSVPVATDANGELRFGFNLPAGIGGTALDTQGVFLHVAAANGLTTTQGTRARLE